MVTQPAKTYHVTDTSPRIRYTWTQFVAKNNSSASKLRGEKMSIGFGASRRFLMGIRVTLNNHSPPHVNDVVVRRHLMTTGSTAIGETWPQLRESRSTKWNLAVAEAEKLLNYPDILLPEDSDLGHDLFNLSNELRKIVGTSHPLLKTAKNLLYKGQINMQVRGLIILLWAKGMIKPEEKRDPEIVKKESYIATLTELLHSGHLIHSGIVDVEKVFSDDDVQVGNVRHANKLAILIGDLMLAKANLLLGKMENTKIFYDITGSIRDYMQGEFVFEEDRHGQECPTESTTFRTWEKRSFLRNASLLANALKAVHTVNGMDENSTKKAYDFGKNLSMAWKASVDLQDYVNVQQKSERFFSLISLPVILHLEKDPGFLELVMPHRKDLSLVNYKMVHDVVRNGKGVEEARNVCVEFIRKAQDDLQELPLSESQKVLHKIVSALEV